MPEDSRWTWILFLLIGPNFFCRGEYKEGTFFIFADFFMYTGSSLFLVRFSV